MKKLKRNLILSGLLMFLAVGALIFSMGIPGGEDSEESLTIALWDLVGLAPKYPDQITVLPPELKDLSFDFLISQQPLTVLVQCRVYDDMDATDYIQILPKGTDFVDLSKRLEQLRKVNPDVFDYDLKSGKIDPMVLKDRKIFAKVKKEIVSDSLPPIYYDIITSSGPGIIFEFIIVYKDAPDEEEYKVIHRFFKTQNPLEVLHFVGSKGHDYFRDFSSRITECRAFPMAGDDFIIGKNAKKYWIAEYSGTNCIIGGVTGKEPPDRTGEPIDDQLWGGRDTDIIIGRKGNDDLKGYSGDDILCGGPGMDHLDGGPGVDGLYGGFHSDFYASGQQGDDIADTAN